MLTCLIQKKQSCKSVSKDPHSRKLEEGHIQLASENWSCSLSHTKETENKATVSMLSSKQKLNVNVVLGENRANEHSSMLKV